MRVSFGLKSHGGGDGTDAQCETATEKGHVSHLLFSSEPTEGNSIWSPMKLDQMIGIDKEMSLTFF